MFKKKKAPTEPEYHDTEVANVQFVITDQKQLERLENIYKAFQTTHSKWTKQDILQFAVSTNNDNIMNLLLTYLEIRLDVPVKGNEEPSPR